LALPNVRRDLLVKLRELVDVLEQLPFES